MALGDVLKVTAQVVSSAAFHPRAAKAIYDVVKEQNPSDGYLPELKGWSETGGHLPVIWGSGWACDVPYLLNEQIEDGCTDEQLRDTVVALRGPTARTLEDYEYPEVRRTHDIWQMAFRVARMARNRIGDDTEVIE